MKIIAETFGSYHAHFTKRLPSLRSFMLAFLIGKTAYLLFCSSPVLMLSSLVRFSLMDGCIHTYVIGVFIPINIIFRHFQEEVQDALRYFPPGTHDILEGEFIEELRNYGHIYMYRFRPTLKMR